MAMSEREKLLNDAVYNQILGRIKTEKPTYQNSYEEQLNDTLQKIQNRETFSYDFNTDPMYQMYKNQYAQMGQMAMKDTIGQAAALTGGYGNTYGEQAGQQAYNAYLQKLNEVIPELYKIALDKYNAEGSNLKDQMSLLTQLSDTEYGRYRDSLSDWNYDQQLVRDEESKAYSRRMEEEAIARELEQLAYERAWNEDERAYSRAWDEDERSYSRQKYEEEVARALEEQQYNRAWNEDQRAYERQKYDEEVARALEEQAYNRAWNEENRDYTRQKYDEEVARQLEQQAYERQIYQEEQAWEQAKYQDQTWWDRTKYNYEAQRQDEMYADEVAREQEQLAYNRAWNEENRDYTRQMTAEEIRRDIENNAYTRQQQAYSNLYAIIKTSGYYPSDEELSQAGMSREMADSLISEYNRQILLEDMAYSGSGSSGGGSSRSSGGGGGGGGYVNYDYSQLYEDDDEGDDVVAYEIPTVTPETVNKARDWVASKKEEINGPKYSLSDLGDSVAALGSRANSNQIEELIRSMKQEVNNGNTNFTMEELNRYVQQHHW